MKDEVSVLNVRGRQEPIHWLVQEQSDIPRNDIWLSRGEREKLAEFRFPKRRNDWLLGRWTAKKLLSAFLAIPPRDMSSLEIIAARDGAPEVWLHGEPAQAVLSISHSEGMAFCAAAATNFALGCDIEAIISKDPVFLQDYFTGEEQGLCSQTPESDRALAATLIWSSKESALKAMREGLRRDTRSVVVGLDIEWQPDSWNRLTVRCQQSGALFEGWWSLRQRRVLTLVSKPGAMELIQIAP